MNLDGVLLISENDIFYWNDEDGYIITDEGNVVEYGDFIIIEDNYKRPLMYKNKIN